MKQITSRFLRRRPPPWPLHAPEKISAFSREDRSLTVLPVCHNMPKQIGNTVRSLVPQHQQGIDPRSYRVRVMDNGSTEPVPDRLWRISDNVDYDRITPEDRKGNFGVALNLGVARTQSNILCLIFDGACLVSPGLLKWGVDLCTISPRIMVDARCWHLGSKLQMQSMHEGYTTEVESGLLAGIGWPAPSYRLFEIAVPFPRRGGFFGRAAETTCLFISRQYYEELGGFDTRYLQPGGGLTAADFFHRAATGADRVFTLLGEAVFHQIHGGVATGLEREQHKTQFKTWREEYERISRPWHGSGPEYQPVVVGHVPPELRPWLSSPASSEE